jgi:ribulose kinase
MNHGQLSLWPLEHLAAFQRCVGLFQLTTDNKSANIVRRGAMMKLFCIIAAAMALVVASSTAMAEPKKRSVSNKATQRMKSPQPSRVPTYDDRLREYYELKRQGWYKEDKA